MFIRPLVMAFVLAAFTPLAHAEQRVVVLNLEVALLSTEAAKQADAKLRERPEIAEQLERFGALERRIGELQSEIEKNDLIWSSEQKAEAGQQMNQVRAEHQQVRQRLEAERRSALNVFLKEYEPKAKQALGELIEEQGIDLVLNAKSAFHAQPDADITALLTKKINDM